MQLSRRPDRSRLRALSGPSPADRRARVLLCVLASVAGVTDAVNYLAFGHVFTANMTGNTVLLGIAIVNGDGGAVARSACALAGFCAGVALGARGIAGHSSGVWPRRATQMLVVEAVTLAVLGGCAAYFGVGVSWTYGLIVLSGLAMGIQSAAVLAIDVPGVATTYITGTLTQMISKVVDRSEPPDKARSVHVRRERGTGLVAASIWGSYLAAAVVGAAATNGIGARALWIAAAIVAAVSVIATVSRASR